MDQKQIEKNKQRSMAFYNARKRKQEQMKEGRAYCHKQRMELFKVKVDDLLITAAVDPEHFLVNEELIVWCCCSPKDEYSERIARGLIGWRASQCNMNFIYRSRVQTENAYERASKLMSWFVTQAYSAEPRIPPRLQKAVIKVLRAGDSQE